MAIDLGGSDPFYQQIANDLKARIQNGAFSVGDRIGSHRELSEHYEVSLITVKKALSELVHAGLLYTHVGKGTYVAAPPKLAEAPTRSIGVLLRDVTEPFFAKVLQDVEAHAYERGFSVMVSISGGQHDKEETQIEHLRRSGVDGLIIASLHHGHHASAGIKALDADDFPYVMVSYTDDPTAYYIGVDYVEGARLATTHLIQRGYQRIAYLGVLADYGPNDRRREGYRLALEQHGRRYDPALVYEVLDGFGWVRHDAAYAFGQDWVTQPNRPDAVFVYNDTAALGFQRAVLEAGVRIPDALGVVGFDDIERSAVAPVPLTSVQQPMAVIGQQAVQLLARRIKHEAVQRRTLLTPRLVVRASTDPDALRGRMQATLATSPHR
ncbi:MAG: GntR family transcriptional regulator [Bacteroidota bacterium]